MNNQTISSAAIAFRVLLFCYSIFQDKTPVKFTDVDYQVFSDAAFFVTNGLSPYSRSTFRYTPLLAYLNTLNFYIHPLSGKIIFCLCDLITGYLIYSCLKLQNIPKITMLSCVAFWILNPFVAIISVRGSSESILGVLILSTIYLLLKKQYFLSAFFFGLSVHFKIFPIIYALPIWISIPSNHFISWARLKYGIISAATFLSLALIFFNIYGYEFLHESYFYHLGRKDHRHNFSIYFYPLYLSHFVSKDSILNYLLGASGSFIPQFGLVFTLGGLLGKQNLILACFAQTFAFVTLNKVVTSQYFMWYLFFLPLIVPFNQLAKTKFKTGIFLIIIWIASQALWLFFAYQLEHLGKSTFRELWAASCVFYLVNCVILGKIIINQN